jgi:hypothetical protein
MSHNNLTLILQIASIFIAIVPVAYLFYKHISDRRLVAIVVTNIYPCEMHGYATLKLFNRGNRIEEHIEIVLNKNLSYSYESNTGTNIDVSIIGHVLTVEKILNNTDIAILIKVNGESVNRSDLCIQVSSKEVKGTIYTKEEEIPTPTSTFVTKVAVLLSISFLIYTGIDFYLEYNADQKQQEELAEKSQQTTKEHEEYMGKLQKEANESTAKYNEVMTQLKKEEDERIKEQEYMEYRRKFLEEKGWGDYFQLNEYISSDMSKNYTDKGFPLELVSICHDKSSLTNDNRTVIIMFLAVNKTSNVMEVASGINSAILRNFDNKSSILIKDIAQRKTILPLKTEPILFKIPSHYLGRGILVNFLIQANGESINLNFHKNFSEGECVKSVN